MSAAIVGRSGFAALAEFLSRVTAPHPAARRAAGGGKTTLWEHAVAAAREQFHVLTARPLRLLAHSGVGDLLDGVHDAFAELPAPQAHALREALLLESPDPPASISAVLHWASSAPRGRLGERPVLVAVDDLQRLDAASSRVLPSAARRLAEEQVALLFALCEPEAPSSFAPGARSPGS